MHAVIHLLFNWGASSSLVLYVLLVSDLIALTQVPTILLRRRGRPVAALSWLLALFTLPWVGLFLWWLFGRVHLQRKLRKRQQHSQAFCECLPSELRKINKGALNLFQGVLPWSAMSQQRWLAFPPSQNNQVTLLVNGEEAFAAMEQGIQQAKEYIHLLFYIWKPDQTGTYIRDLLVQKAREGVTVRLLIDAWGQPKKATKFFAPLQEAGGRISFFLPVRFFSSLLTINFRNHRKLMIIDGTIAFTGGMNISNEYKEQWRDTAIKIVGPTTTQLHEVFLEDWYFASDENLANAGYLTHATEEFEVPEKSNTVTDVACAIIPSGPDGRTNWCHDTLFLTLSSAKSRIYLTTPYFIPNGSITAALRGAAQRGVDVRILLPQKSDLSLVRIASRTYYEALLEAGVKIYEFEPCILHAKTLVLDEHVSILGSANVDIRSFRLNFEIGCMLYSQSFNAQLAKCFITDLRQSTEVTHHGFTKNQRQPLLESAAHLLSPLL